MTLNRMKSPLKTRESDSRCPGTAPEGLRFSRPPVQRERTARDEVVILGPVGAERLSVRPNLLSPCVTQGDFDRPRDLASQLVGSVERAYRPWRGVIGLRLAGAFSVPAPRPRP